MATKLRSAIDRLGELLPPLPVQGRAKERDLSLVREVPSEPIGCASAAVSQRVVEGKEIQTENIPFARACIVSVKVIDLQTNISPA